MSYSDRFLESFRTAYNQCRQCFQPEQAWKEVWQSNSKWNRFMLWNPPSPQQKPVLNLTAQGMGLAYWDREPFRLDAAFIGSDSRVVGNLFFPLVVGIEHEKDVSKFEEEISKLAHIRCHLKVGITYCSASELITSPQELAKRQNQIVAWVRKCCETLNSYTTEDERTEYVYVLAVAKPNFVQDWHALSFRANDDPGQATWVTI
jgi:hypothetical protein